jgi:hypothetical protein
MHIKLLEIENFGPFKGVQRVVFSCSNDQNITVICGGNTSGKSLLIRSIAWALGGSLQNDYEFYEHYLDHKGNQATRVTLRFSIGDRDYTSRKQIITANKHRSEEIQLSVRKHHNEEFKNIINPEEHIRTIIPEDLRETIFDFEPPHLMPNDCSKNVLNIPGFRFWANNKIKSYSFGGELDEHIVNFLKRYFAGKAHDEAVGTGVVHMAWLYTMKLFHEWFLAAEALPPSWQHLRGQSLPWILDSPFGELSTDYRHQAAKCLTSSRAQIVLADSPHRLHTPVETMIEPRLGRLHLLRTVNNYFRGSSATVFGRTLVLSREDSINFSEIVSICSNREGHSHG